MVRQIGRHPLLIALAMFAVVVLARPVAAQDGRLQGVVTDAARMPIAGAKITIELKDSGRKFTTTTNAKGEYIQVGLVAGQYVLMVEKDKLSSMRTVMLRGATVNNQNFVLGAAAEAAAASPAAAEMQKAFTEGLDASKAGNHDEAIARFSRAAELNPKCADCFYNIGYSQSQKKDYDKAEEAFKKAIDIKADYADAYNGLANIYNAQRKFDLAAAASTKAAELAAAAPGGAAGGSPDAMFNQGVILWNAGKIADAKKQFEAVIAAKPDHAEAHYQLAMALVNEGDLKGAGAQFDTYLKLAPNGPNAATAKALSAQLPK
jgi:tetratricopeptide (TPR) repeat protein